MDFSYSEDQTLLRDLAREILDKEVTTERRKEVEQDPDWLDRGLWSALAEANLLGLVAPEDLGGMGLGIEEVCLLLQEIGRVVAPVPLLPALVLASLPLAEFGTDEQKRAWLAPVASGEAILTGALVDAGSRDPSAPATTAKRDGDAWVLDGEKRLVPAVHLSRRVLVPATTDEGAGVFLVDPQAEGVSLTRQETSRGEPLFSMRLAEVRVAESELLGGDSRSGDRVLRWLHDHATVAVCATQIGVCERALEITAEYARERVQFGVPIGSFQAVQHRLADCLIDLESIRWTTWRAVSRLARGLPAAREAAVAKFWAAEGGARIASAAQHLHAGLGVDLEYPIHRYFLWSKSLELELGAAAPQLVRLGGDMARTGPQELQ
jgi:alkylation response protein AidB-like acyl-CoA dehydrogenase